MIPRTVKMAAEVAAQFTPTELDDFGNILLNGYLTTGPNTSGKLAWQYKETSAAPVPLPSVSSVQPMYRGWTTNYAEYYTQLPVNAYNVNPGDPTMFEYTVHSFTLETGGILYLSWINPGQGYTPGTYTSVALTGGSGSGATADIVVVADPDPAIVGYVQSVTLVNPGTGYTSNDAVSAVIPGGSGFTAAVGQIDPVPGTGAEPRWAQPPHRFYQNQVADFVPPTVNQQAIQYSFIYPVADNPTPPPIGTL